jgi:hypothetical protein
MRAAAGAGFFAAATIGCLPFFLVATFGAATAFALVAVWLPSADSLLDC